MNYLESLKEEVGKWQLILMITASICLINMGPCYLVVYFFTSQQNYWCSLPNNFTIQNPGKDTMDYMNRDSCEIPIKSQASNISNNINDTHEMYKCTSWEYDHSEWKKTLLEDFNLVCERDILISTSTFTYMVSTMVGAAIFGALADLYGRKLIFLIAMVGWTLSSLITAFSANYEMFTVMRFLVGTFGYGGNTVGYVWSTESIGSKGRSIYATALGLLWSASMLSIAAISYFTRNWFMAHIIISLLASSTFLFSWSTIESPSWLFTVGEIEKGIEMLTKAAYMNGKVPPDPKRIEQEIKDSNKQSTKSTLLDLLRYKNSRKNNLILFYNWFVVSFVYFAMTFSSGNLGGDLFLNITIAAIMEGFGYIIAVFLLLKIGRRLPTALCFILSGLCSFLIAVIPNANETAKWSRIVIALIGRTAISISYNNLFVYSLEINPTAVRSMALASGTIMSHIGSMVAPYTKELGLYTNTIVPMVLYGLLGTTAGVAGLFLPETRDRTLPNTLEEGETHWKKPFNVHAKMPIERETENVEEESKFITSEVAV